jgi:uncharacterized repeat protein (TIGR02543 family)
MAIKVLNEFKVYLENNTETVFMAENLSAAAAALETPAIPLVQVSRVRTGVEVDVPDPDVFVKFEVVVTPDTAKTSGCVGTPMIFTVKAGSNVIFTAIPAPGFVFDGWYRENVLLSSDETDEIAVAAALPEELTAKIEARFAPAI